MLLDGTYGGRWLRETDDRFLIESTHILFINPLCLF